MVFKHQRLQPNHPISGKNTSHFLLHILKSIEIATQPSKTTSSELPTVSELLLKFYHCGSWLCNLQVLLGRNLGWSYCSSLPENLHLPAHSFATLRKSSPQLDINLTFCFPYSPHSFFLIQTYLLKKVKFNYKIKKYQN